MICITQLRCSEKLQALYVKQSIKNLIAQNIIFERNPRNHNQFLFGNSPLIYCNIFMRSNLI